LFSLAHLHLLLNHWPIIVPMLALLLLAVSRVRRSEPPGRIGLAFLIGAAVAALPTYLTGEDAEIAIKDAPGVTKAIVERHSDAALIGSLVLGALGVFALWVLWRYRTPGLLPRWAITAALAGALIGSGLMAWVGLLGGEVRHTEIRAEAPPAFGTGVSGGSRLVPSTPARP